MFFMFYILISAVSYLPKTNSIYLRDKIEESDVTDIDYFKYKDGTRNKTWSLSTHKPFFQIIKNLTNPQKTNLKSNFFDKMLSDEMFSLQQLLHEKDIRKFYTSTTVLPKKSNEPTLTLEAKQKWQAIDLFSEPDIKEHIVYEDIVERHNSNVSDAFKSNEEFINDPQNIISNTASEENETSNNSINQKNKDKVVGLRSLPELALRADKMCTCMKTNPSTTCSHRCSASSVKDSTKSHANFHNHRLNKHECTRSTATYSPVMSYTTPFVSYVALMSTTALLNPPFPAVYVPYQTYLVEKDLYDDNYNSKPRKKHKHRKKTHSSDNMFYETHDERYFDNEDKYIDDFLENDMVNTDLDIMKPKQKPNYDYFGRVKGKSKAKHKNKKHQKSNKNIDLNSDDNVIYSGKKSRFVKDVVDDLKYFYADVIIKDCYCPSFANVITPKVSVYLFVLLVSVRSSISNMLFKIEIRK